MAEKERDTGRSHALAIRLYDKWVRERQKRPEIRSTEDARELKKLATENFKTQLLEPRQSHLEDLKKAKSMTFADQAALLVLMELPTLETSTLLHRLGRQISEDPDAVYFSKVNLADNCGTGCGCGCGAMRDLSYQEKIVLHHQTKPFSIDPFNELGTPTKVRDSLLVRDFLASFERLTGTVSERVNKRYFEIGRAFAVEGELRS